MENYNRLFLLDDSDMNDAERIEFIRSSGETPAYEDYIKADTERKPGHINLSQIDESRGFIKMEGLKNFEAPIYNLENGEFEVGNLFDFVHDIALGDQLSDIQEDALTEIDIKNYIAKLHATEPSKYEHTISEYTEDQYEYTELISPASAEEFIVAHNIADGKQDEFVFSVREELESISEVKFVLYNGVVVEEFQVNEYQGDGTFVGNTTVSIVDPVTGLRVVALEGARISIYGTTFKLTELMGEIKRTKKALESIEGGAQAILDTYATKLEAEKVAAEDAAQVAQGEVEMIENQVIENKLASEKQHAELRASRNEDSIKAAKEMLIRLGEDGINLKNQMASAVSKFTTLMDVLSLKLDEETGDLVTDPDGTDAYAAALDASNVVRGNNASLFTSFSQYYNDDMSSIEETKNALESIASTLTGGGQA